MDLKKLAVELAAALEPVVPSEVTLSVEGPTLYLSLAGTASWTQADLRSMYDWDADALVEWVLDGFQTDLAELTTEPWPAAAPAPMPEPFAEVRRGELVWGYGDPASPVLAFPPIRLEDVR